MHQPGYLSVTLFAAITLSASFASAQGTPAAAPAPAAAAPAAPAPAEEAHKDGVRFRGGISAAGGGLFISGFSAGMGGVDGRLGVQINDLIGIYAQPEFSLGAGKIAGLTGFTGTADATLLVDATFLDQIFVAAGGGAGIIGNAPGALMHFRLGGYPAMSHSTKRARRTGLMLGVDMRVYFITGGSVLQPMASIGYEAF